MWSLVVVCLASTLVVGAGSDDVDAQVWDRVKSLVHPDADENRRLAVFYVQRAMIHVGNGELIKGAADYENALRTRGMSADERQDVLGKLARIYLTNEEFRPAAHALEVWLAADESPGAENMVLLALAYLQIGEYERAAEVAARAAAVGGDRAENEEAVERLVAAFASLDLQEELEEALRDKRRQDVGR